MRPITRIALPALSCGWLLPLAAAYDFYVTYLEREVVAQMQGRPPITSFPNGAFSVTLVKIAAVWLAVAISVWVWIATRRWGERLESSRPAV